MKAVLCILAFRLISWMFIMESSFGARRRCERVHSQLQLQHLCSFTQENLDAYMASPNYLSGHSYLLGVQNDPFLANT